MNWKQKISLCALGIPVWEIYRTGLGSFTFLGVDMKPNKTWHTGLHKINIFYWKWAHNLPKFVNYTWEQMRESHKMYAVGVQMYLRAENNWTIRYYWINFKLFNEKDEGLDYNK